VLLLPNEPDRRIFVVRIPRSQRRPHMVSSNGIYYRRGKNGTTIIMHHFAIIKQDRFSSYLMSKRRKNMRAKMRAKTIDLDQES
jgi:hypothetical protein